MKSQILSHLNGNKRPILRGDVLSVKIPFFDISHGLFGVCIEAKRAKSGIMKIVVVMENDRSIEVTDREVHLLFRFVKNISDGKNDIVSLDALNKFLKT